MKTAAELLSGGLGSFLGAFFAFVFYRLGTFLTDRIERSRRHHNALVKMEHGLNDALNAIADNRYVIAHFQPAAREGHPVWMLPRAVQLDRSPLIDLLNLDLLNEAVSVHTMVGKINSGIEDAVRAYLQMRDARVSGHLDAKQFVENSLALAAGLEQIDLALAGLETDVKGLTARVRVLLRKDRPRQLLIKWRPPKSARVSAIEIAKESALLDKEIEEISSSSRRDIDRIYGSTDRK